MNGIVVLDKPGGVSSAAAVDRVKRVLGAKRAGHGGTLDPMATGVLVICLGEATKVASYLLADAKSYIAEFALGIETDTLDRTGTVVASRDASHISEQMMKAALSKRIGEQDQVPPMYSAIKHRGVRLYQHARSGLEIERMPRRISIDHLELIAFNPPRVTLAISCSKGTYIRSLVSDLGNDLGCGGHLVELRRTRSGVFTIDQAVRLDELEGHSRTAEDRRMPVDDAGESPTKQRGVQSWIDLSRVLPMEAALTLPIVQTPPALVGRVRSGVQLAMHQLPGSEVMQQHAGSTVTPTGAGRFQLRDESNRLIAIAHIERDRVVYDRVFVTG